MQSHSGFGACGHTHCRFIDNGGVFKLEFGPKAFIVVSDPVVVRHLLKVRLLGAAGGAGCWCRLCAQWVGQEAA